MDKQNMKKLILFVFPFLLYQIGYGQNLQIKIYNKTGYDLDSISIGDTYVGLIKKHSSKIVLECKFLDLQDGRPYGLPNGIAKGLTKDTSWLIPFCSTGLKSVTTGKFKFDITLNAGKEGYRLYWRKH